MSATRVLPVVGALGWAGPDARVVTIVEVEGASIVVEDDAGVRTAFRLHPLTGHWVRATDPYWGLRLALAPPIEDG